MHLTVEMPASDSDQTVFHSSQLPPVVGTWLVKTPEAPFPYHMFTFHSDGTMLHSNPDAGDSSTSDSNGMEGRRFERYRERDLLRLSRAASERTVFGNI